MRKNILVAGLSALLCLSNLNGFAKTPTASKSPDGTIVIVFRDGHRQSFSLAEIDRVEFPNSAVAMGGSTASLLPPRFIGKWEVGDGNGSNFYITLETTGDAKRSLGNVHGRWVYEGGEARITWDDGAQDAIRRSGSGYQKRAFSEGKSFTDEPDNVTNAQNRTPHPI
jgi:hypothetical protein